jgi:PHD/YefM family antitoxin component YafN of YafNO toxin-antitoxin module
MTEKTYSISEIQDIAHLAEQFEEEDLDAVNITSHGEPLLTILPTSTYNTLKELYEKIDSLLETIEVLQDEELMAAFRQGVKEMEEGKGEPLDDVLKELGWE